MCQTGCHLLLVWCVHIMQVKVQIRWIEADSSDITEYPLDERPTPGMFRSGFSCICLSMHNVLLFFFPVLAHFWNATAWGWHNISCVVKVHQACFYSIEKSTVESVYFFIISIAFLVVWRNVKNVLLQAVVSKWSLCTRPTKSLCIYIELWMDKSQPWFRILHFHF